MRIFATTVFTFCMLVSYAQVIEATAMMSQGSNNGISISLKGTQSNAVDAAWMKFIKSYKGKTKMNKKAAELFSDNAMIKGMSGNTVDVYSKTAQNGDDVELSVWFDLGGAYVSSASHPEAYTIGESMLIDFSKTVSTAAIEEEIKMEETAMGKMENEMKSLLKDKMSLEGEIKKCEAKISEAKAKIETNKAAQVEQQMMIDMQKDKVKMVKDKLKAVN